MEPFYMKNNKLIYFILTIFMYAVGFSSIFRLCKNDSWIVILIGSIISFLILPIYKKLIKNNRYIKLFNIIFILLINMMILRIFTTSFYLTKTPGLLVTIPFLLLCLYNSNKGIDNLVKESNILFLFSVITIMLNLVSSTKTGSISFFTPILSSSFINIIKGILYYIVFIFSPLILIDDINNKLFIFTNLFILFMVCIITFVLGPNLMSIYRFPEYMIYKEIYLFGFIENVENLVGLIYFLNLFITSSLCLINIKKIVKSKYTLYITIISVLYLTEFVSDKYMYSLVIYKYLPIILIMFIFLNTLKKE